MNILCGPNQSTREIDYVGPGMEMQKVELAKYVDRIFEDIFDRMKKNPLLIVFPNLF